MLAAIHIPNFTPDRMPRLDLVDFPGDNDPDGIDLLGYPWLYHELGHLLLGQHGQTLAITVCSMLDEGVLRNATKGLGKARLVQERLIDLHERVDTAWRPSENHTDWSHEIATDVVGLWSCGPAFLASHDDILD